MQKLCLILILIKVFLAIHAGYIPDKSQSTFTRTQFVWKQLFLSLISRNPWITYIELHKIWILTVWNVSMPIKLIYTNMKYPFLNWKTYQKPCFIFNFFYIFTFEMIDDISILCIRVLDLTMEKEASFCNVHVWPLLKWGTFFGQQAQALNQTKKSI